MNLPALPTDNLYKFLALSGVALVVFSFIFPLDRLAAIQLKRVEMQTQAEVLLVELSNLEKEVDRAAGREKVSDEVLKDLQARRLQLAIKHAEVNGAKAQVAVLLEQFERAWSVLIVGMFAGIALANVGFFLWYYRVQKPADLLARKQLEKTDA